MIYGQDYDKQPRCEIDGAKVESTASCNAPGVHSCDNRQVCDSHAVQCPWCHVRMCLDCYVAHTCDLEPTEESWLEMERVMSSEGLSNLSYVARSAIKEFCTVRGLSELYESSVYDPKNCAWLLFLLRAAPDHTEWFPHGKWATLQRLEQIIDSAAEYHEQEAKQ